jgi:hypothetical protein
MLQIGKSGNLLVFIEDDGDVNKPPMDNVSLSLFPSGETVGFFGGEIHNRIEVAYNGFLKADDSIPTNFADASAYLVGLFDGTNNEGELIL